MTEGLKTVLFIDFDNVYSSLRETDPEAARRFATEPAIWLKAIEDGTLIKSSRTGERDASPERRILMRMCYANPAIMRTFRGYYTRAGFQIIDCPALTGRGKNSSDIQMVMDMLDAVGHDTRFDEFIILSADADFTPVLFRLRAHDRKTTIYANDITATAYRAASDGMVMEDSMIALLNDALGADDSSTAITAKPEQQHELNEIADKILRAVFSQMAEAKEAVRLSDLATQVRGMIGEEEILTSNWAGYGGFRALLRARMDDTFIITAKPPAYIFDPERHKAPADTDEAVDPLLRYNVPTPMRTLIRRINQATNIPALAPVQYGALFKGLTDELKENAYLFPKTVQGAVTRMNEAGIDISRRDAGFIIKGLVLAGHMFTYADTPETLANRFRDQVFYLCQNAEMDMSEETKHAIAEWITGIPSLEDSADETSTAADSDEAGSVPLASAG